ncbi:glutaredoxin 3 [Leucothrix pacifica]|uniref:Glutaredoxin n=1 Tax=Leucothrix pacifica TaxID=1247513 RepID=A0A317CUK0_9GAMM|nr:glutaredoxin 3 [Leucothrix pacifica]PWR00003.1 glutaredoxin 3 [Leucothrix pacifica]
MSAKVVMYTTRFCPYCMRARSMLKNKGIEFEDIAVGNDPALWQKMQTLSGRDTVPQIFINDQAVGGYDDIALLERQGKLDPLLNIEQ